MPNRHPVDELADCRAEIKLLKAREEKLRADVLANPEDRTGDEHEATIIQSTTERVDLDLMKRELGLQFLQPFLRKRIASIVRTKKKRA